MATPLDALRFWRNNPKSKESYKRTISIKSLIEDYLDSDPFAEQIERDVEVLVRRMYARGDLQKEPFSLKSPPDPSQFAEVLTKLVKKNLYHNADLTYEEEEGSIEDERTNLFKDFDKDKESQALNSIMMSFVSEWVKNRRDKTPFGDQYEKNPNTDRSKGGENGMGDEDEDEYVVDSVVETISWVFGKIKEGAFVLIDAIPVKSIVYYTAGGLGLASTALGLIRQPGFREKAKYMAKMTAMYVGGHVVSMTVERLDVSDEFGQGTAAAASVFSTGMQNVKSATSLIQLVNPSSDTYTKIQSMISITQNWVLRPILGQSSFYSSYTPEQLFKNSQGSPNRMFHLIMGVWDAAVNGGNSYRYIRDGGFEVLTIYVLEKFGDIPIDDPRWGEHRDFAAQGGLKLRNLWLPKQDQIEYPLLNSKEVPTPAIIKQILSDGETAYYTTSVNGIVRFGIKNSDVDLPAVSRAAERTANALALLPFHSEATKKFISEFSRVGGVGRAGEKSEPTKPSPVQLAAVIEAQQIHEIIPPTTTMNNLDPAFDQVVVPEASEILIQKAKIEETRSKLNELYNRLDEPAAVVEEASGQLVVAEQEEKEEEEEEKQQDYELLVKEALKKVSAELLDTMEDLAISKYTTLVQTASTAYYNIEKQIIQSGEKVADFFTSSADQMYNYIINQAQLKVDESILVEECLYYVPDPEVEDEMVETIAMWTAINTEAKKSVYTIAETVQSVTKSMWESNYVVPGRAASYAVSAPPPTPLFSKVEPEALINVITYLTTASEKGVEVLSTINDMIAERFTSPKAEEAEAKVMINKAANLYTRALKMFVFDKRVNTVTNLRRESKLEALKKSIEAIKSTDSLSETVDSATALSLIDPEPTALETLVKPETVVWENFEDKALVVFGQHPDQVMALDPPHNAVVQYQGSGDVDNSKAVTLYQGDVAVDNSKAVVMYKGEEEEEEKKEKPREEEKEEEKEKEEKKKKKNGKLISWNPYLDIPNALKQLEDRRKYERDRLTSLRAFFPVMGTEVLDEQQSEESNKLKENNLLMGQLPYHSLGRLDNKLWVGNQAREGLIQSGDLNTAPIHYMGGSLTEGDTLFGTVRSTLPRVPSKIDLSKIS